MEFFYIPINAQQLYKIIQLIGVINQYIDIGIPIVNDVRIIAKILSLRGNSYHTIIIIYKYTDIDSIRRQIISE